MCSILGFCGKDTEGKIIKDALEKTHSRGPDDYRVMETGNGFLAFNRLAIMGLTENGMQPFAYGDKKTLKYSKQMYADSKITTKPEGSEILLVCNGEIYGFRKSKEELLAKGYEFISDSDCEILPALYKEYGTDMFAKLDAEYALILYDAEKDSYIAARDPIGIRPLYYGKTAAGTFVFASEPKNLTGLCKRIMPFPPGHYFKDGQFIQYRDMSSVKTVIHEDMETVTKEIHDRLIEGVKKRLDSDAPVGFLLSGGLDSSLVCGIAASLSDKPLQTWAIGMDIDAIDLKYAREVADYIHSDHHEVIISQKDVVDAVDEVIKTLGTYDITTTRASIGMYLVCKAIHEQSDTRVLLTGEISDEIFGYKYTDFAPDAQAFQTEAEKRIRELHMYDVLRADRCISVNSLEARVPFGDLDFVEYCMAIDPEMKMNRYGKGKYLLRKAFEKDALIPESILWREKAAFSDAVGHSLKDDLAELAERTYSDADYELGIKKYEYAKPFTKESLLYRDIFEKYYPGQAEMVVDFWMPNKNWEGCNVTDPSARVLSNYGESGK
ncbi:MAG: asparagine synthase B [Lachnospiraceae bacterium]|nr:asparagine synthase B [Lachnospiraceae bacterium]MBR6850325.1 asparagine synthase B [Lachnospiraceae bacterium]